MVDYRKFRFSKLKTPEFSHILLLLYWPLFGLIFAFLERGLPWLVGLFGGEITYFPIWCPTDEIIPFCEWFILPYYFWFVFLIGMLIYSFFFDVVTFRKYMWFIILTYTFCALIYFVFPNMQEFRPLSREEIGRDNLLIDIAFMLYGFDTNTNVFPSMHVTGAFAVCCSAWHSKHFSKWYWCIIFSVITIFICLSTVFLRQHSILDIYGGVAVSLVAYILLFHSKWAKRLETKSF